MTLIAALLLLAAAPTTVDLPFRHLALKKDVRLTEGTRGLDDAFPYLDYRTEGMDRPHPLVPAALPRVLKGRIDTPEAAYEAVRLFVAGVPIEDGKPLVKEAALLGRELKVQTIRFPDTPPKGGKRTIERDGKGWRISFLAYEMDRLLQLVRIEATVSGTGKLALRRVPVFQGPMTSWQSALVEEQAGGKADPKEDKEAAMRNDAVLARHRFAKALRPPRDLETAWTIARLRLAPRQIEDLWPGKRRIVGSGLKIVAFDLADGTCVTYDATVPTHPVMALSHMQSAEGPTKHGAVLHRFSLWK